MSISTECPECGKRLKAPDSAAGRQAKCPQCGAAVRIPEPVYDAEEVSDVDASDAEYGDADDESYGLAAPPSRPVAARESDDRRPCPMCGEMIRATAVKCRYCGEVFDATLKRSGHGRIDPDQIRRFRREMHGLGGFWIFMAFLVILALLAINHVRDRLPPDMQETILLVLLVFEVLYVGIGIFVFLKHMWAVWVGLVLAYLSLLGNVISFAQGNVNCGSVFAIILLGAVIVQSHRVIKWAGELRRAGVPLTATV